MHVLSQGADYSWGAGRGGKRRVLWTLHPQNHPGYYIRNWTEPWLGVKTYQDVRPAKLFLPELGWQLGCRAGLTGGVGGGRGPAR